MALPLDPTGRPPPVHGASACEQETLLTVHFDGDLAFIVSSLGVDLRAASVLTIISRRDVADPQSARLVLVPAPRCNRHATSPLYQRSLSPSDMRHNRPQSDCMTLRPTSLKSK